MATNTLINPVVDAYIAGVMDGTVIVGGWIRKAIQRHLRDLKRTDIYFDADAANRVIDFCETFCIPSASSEPIKLMPWQQTVIAIVYGWKRPDGYRRFRRVYLEVSKKNGKTSMAAALALYHLTFDGELSARVFIAATALKQAKECFMEAVAMRDKGDVLQEHVKKNGNSPVISLYAPETNSRLSPMTRGSDSQDGAVVSAAILDELHRWKKTDSLYPILRFGGDTRKQPLLIQITTAGASSNKSSLCWDEHEYVCNILDGTVTDDEVAGFIFSLDPKDDIKDERNWVKPNPSLGGILPLSALQNQFREAKGKPSAMGEYKRYRLNIWTDEAAEPAIDIESWDECCVEPYDNHPDPVRLRRELIETLQGRPCYGGCDLAPKHDTSSLVLVYPPTDTDLKWYVVEWFWIPANDLTGREERDDAKYKEWVEKGFLVATPEYDITDYRYIADQITEITKQYDLRELAYDASWSNELLRMLAEAKFPLGKLTEFPQTPMWMNDPCYQYMRMIDRKELAHGNNPVMRHQTLNLRWAKSKTSDFIKPFRIRKKDKIDGCAALIMAIGRATHPDNVPKPKMKFWAVTG